MFRRRAILLLVFIGLLSVQPAASQQTQTHTLGTFEWQASTNGILITAPHGTFDRNTAMIAIEAAQLLGAGYVVARGFNPGVRINVNRPTEGSGLACDREPQTERARDVAQEYEQLVASASGGAPLGLYVEVHGNSRAETSGNLEVATKGISVDAGTAVKTAFPSMLATVKLEWPSYPTLQILIEPIDPLYWTASCLKRLGVLAGSRIVRALHFEFPSAARELVVVPATSVLIAGIVRRVTR